MTLLLCFSHLRWNFVYQRPQHLMTRCAKTFEVLYFEEPVFEEGARARLELQSHACGVTVAVPVLPTNLSETGKIIAQKQLLDGMLKEKQPVELALWYYTPMALPFSRHLEARLCVYDCMDELSGFKDAPPAIFRYESELFNRADLVFTGGYSLYEAKKESHPRVYAYPSSVEMDHFRRGRLQLSDPADQAAVPHPRLGFYGVVDERFDIELVRDLALLRPDWHQIILGPVVKIDPASLPQGPNIHYLGSKSYNELPDYVAGWDIALMPFARNAATRYISPTKTPEYLAAGRPVISTSIRDVVQSYGKAELVAIADTASELVTAAENILQQKDRSNWLKRVDTHLAQQSWDMTWSGMLGHLRTAMQQNILPPETGKGKTMEFVAGKRPITASPSPLLSRLALPKKYDWLIVGAGFAGSVLAERLARQAGKRVLVIDKRPHIAGNAYDCKDRSGILIHKYGPHIFHTNSDAVFRYLSRFTSWRPYEHRVLASVDGQLLPIPINLDTVNRLYGLNLDSAQLKEFLAARAEPKERIVTSEDVVLQTVGRDLYEKFFRGYTRKQWGLDPSELDKSVTSRVPTRTNRDDRYFTDSYQFMPENGYTRMFENMLDHPNIDIMLNVDFRNLPPNVSYERLIYTGPIDEYFDYQFGALPYRSLRFEHVSHPYEWHQPIAVVNYPQDKEYTRITEYKHLTGQKHPHTSLTYEYPCNEGDPYYPVPRPENAALFKQYQALADALPDVTFVGRLATYRYYNMDQVVAQALATFDRIAGKNVASGYAQTTAGKNESRAL
ncbi:MAG: UDP-galactopyranose mutase [Pseudomonadota bacterium]|nr:UDP-galactopyranose mutase [Pseudomonadota bacterium]